MTKKIGIVCCSDGFKRTYENEIEELQRTLAEMGIKSVFSPFLYARDGVASGTAEERAKAVMDFYLDDTIDAICDISGGDIANGVLPYLDYSMIAKMHKQFWGYSDLTTVLNAIYSKTGQTGVLYQIRNVLYANREQQMTDVHNALCDGGDVLSRTDSHYVQGKEMHGIVPEARWDGVYAGSAWEDSSSGEPLRDGGAHGNLSEPVTADRCI